MSNKRLLLIDGHSLAFRAFYALPPDNFKTATGQHTNAIFGFLSMLARMVEDEAPTAIAVAFDVSRYSFRTREYADYKGGRKETPEEFKDQVPLIKEALDALRIKWFEKEDYEADDIVASFARAGEVAGYEVIISSGDRDTFQLVNEHVTVLYPGKSTADMRRMTPETVLARTGVSPARYPEVAALVGEKADNLPGVPGVGDKTAAQWLNKYDGLDNLLRNADQIGGKRGAALRESIETVKLNRKLNALVTDLPLPPVDSLGAGCANATELNHLFDALEISRLRTRLLDAMAEKPVVVVKNPTVKGEFAENVDVQGWLANLDPNIPVGLVVEGDTRPLGSVDRVVLAQNNSALVWHVGNTAAWDALTSFLAKSGGKMYANDVKGAAHALGVTRLPVKDVQLAAYLCNADQRSYDTPTLAAQYLGRTLSEPEETGMLDMLQDVPTHLCEQAQAIADLAEPLWTELENKAAVPLVDLETRVQKVLTELENTGIAMDRDELQTQARALQKDVKTLEESAYAAIGHSVNLSSPKQLQTVLFEELKMPPTRKTKTGYTTNAAALAELFAKTEHPFLEALLAHRDRIKLLQTVIGLQKAVRADGRIHTTFQQTVAATGRLSSTEPNLQNVPARTDLGRAIRGAFVGGDGYDLILTADYSQIEMRLMAHMSGDKEIITAFGEGEDLHKTMAAMVFEVDPEDVTNDLRSKIKATSYGLAYGLSEYGLSKQLKISVKDAAKLREQYFDRFGGIQKYLDSLVKQARKDGYTETILGRRRYLPDLNSENRQRREMAERAALNAPIQGSAADVIKLAMLAVDKELKSMQMTSRMLLQVHDELVFETTAAECEQLTALVRRAMAKPLELSVPLDVSVGVGKNWRMAAH